MKAYVMTTGVLFGLLVLAHLWRLFAPEWGVAKPEASARGWPGNAALDCQLRPAEREAFYGPAHDRQRRPLDH